MLKASGVFLKGSERVWAAWCGAVDGESASGGNRQVDSSQSGEHGFAGLCGAIQRVVDLGSGGSIAASAASDQASGSVASSESALLMDLRAGGLTIGRLQEAALRLLMESDHRLKEGERQAVACEAAAVRTVQSVQLFLETRHHKVLQDWDQIEQEEVLLLGRRNHAESELLRLEDQLEQASDPQSREAILDQIEKAEEVFEIFGAKLDALQIPLRKAAYELETFQRLKQELSRYRSFPQVVHDLQRDPRLGATLSQYIEGLPNLHWDFSGKCGEPQPHQVKASDYFFECAAQHIEASRQTGESLTPPPWDGLTPKLAEILLRELGMSGCEEAGRGSQIRVEMEASSGHLMVRVDGRGDSERISILRRDVLAQPRRLDRGDAVRARQVRFDELPPSMPTGKTTTAFSANRPVIRGAAQRVSSSWEV
jgi:hypothetical protein